MTSRMAPTATFKAFRPNLEGNFYATDEQNVTVNLEDRTLVSESQSYFNGDDEFFVPFLGHIGAQ